MDEEQAESAESIEAMTNAVAKAVSEFLPGIGYCIMMVSHRAGPYGFLTSAAWNIGSDVIRRIADEIDNSERLIDH